MSELRATIRDASRSLGTKGSAAMGKTANSLQSARLKARQKRIALDVDREARDRRIEDTTVVVFGLLDDREAAEEAIARANAAIGQQLKSLAGEGLTVEQVAQLVDVDVSEVRRLTRSVGSDKGGEPSTGTVTQLREAGESAASSRAV